MGPGSSSLPTQPRFTWDICTTPWTDGRGCQKGFANAVELLEQLYDELPKTNSNKISRDICAKLQLWGRELDLFEATSSHVIASVDDVKVIKAAV